MLIAINSRLVDKPNKNDLSKWHSHFENVDLNANALAAHIKQGHAICAQHKPGVRSTKGFLCAGFLAVDVDHGLRLEEARADEYFQSHATILYTTPSHAADHHRFRVVFKLEKPIYDPVRMRAALSGLIARFGGDGSCKDPCRIFFGSSASTPEVFDRELSESAVDELVLRGEEFTAPTDRGGEVTTRTPVRSRINLPADTEVQPDYGTKRMLRDVPAGTRIYCPQHIDRHPSAFTLRNTAGNPGFYCSSCAATFFLEDGSGRRHSKPYYFDYHWNSLFNATYEEYSAYSDDDGHIDYQKLRGVRVRVLDARHLPFDETVPVMNMGVKAQSGTAPAEDFFEMSSQDVQGLTPDRRLTLVKSPKGTGKTEWLKSLVNSYRGAGATVLMIGHRRALINASARRLGIKSYLPEASDEGQPTEAVLPSDHFAICVDSMRKMDTREYRYDVVVIDEVEQVLAHLLSDTLKEDRREALHTLLFYLRNARAIYALDADLSNVTLEILDAVFEGKLPEYQLLFNNWKPESGTLHLYDQSLPDHLIGELVASLDRGERCYVCSNSKKMIEEIEKGLPEKVSRPIRTILITSANSDSSFVQSFVRNIKTSALEYDAILASPALGTGIDITFEADAQHIDTVFGFFRARINTHFDIDQQLARVRNPKRICVWVSPEEFKFETDSEAIKAEILASESEHQRFLGIDANGVKLYDRDPFYESVYSVITAAHRASKNKLKKNFIDLRQSDGWHVEINEKQADTSEVGKATKRFGQEALRKAAAQRILVARQIDGEGYQLLRDRSKGGALATNDEDAMRRYEIEAFYLRTISQELIDEDDEQRLRRAVQMYEVFLESDEELRKRDRFAEGALTTDKPQYGLQKQLLHELFNKASILQNGHINPDVIVDAAMLSDFASACLEHKPTIERLFKLSIRANVRHDPVRQLRELLKLIGQSLGKDRRDQTGGVSRVLYRIDEGRLATMNAWVERRADSGLRENWKASRQESVESTDYADGVSVEGNFCTAPDPLDS